MIENSGSRFRLEFVYRRIQDIQGTTSVQFNDREATGRRWPLRERVVCKVERWNSECEVRKNGLQEIFTAKVATIVGKGSDVVRYN